MRKTVVSLFIIGVVISAALCSCTNVKPDTEEDVSATDLRRDVYRAIESCTPITEGNLVTKTKYNADGNIQLDYLDSDGNIVENYIIDGDDVLSHSLFVYNDKNVIDSEKMYDRKDRLLSEIKYFYEDDGDFDGARITQYDKGMAKKITKLDKDSELESYAVPKYSKNGQLTRVELFDDDEELKFYFTYEYNESGHLAKFSQFEPDGDLKKETVYEFDEGDEEVTQFDYIYD